jgi:hypothetical protein
MLRNGNIATLNTEHSRYLLLPSLLVLRNAQTLLHIKSTTNFWNITPCSPLKTNLHFGGTYHLHLQGRRISRESYQRERRWQAEQSASRTIGLHRGQEGNGTEQLSSHYLARLTFNGLHGVIESRDSAVV